MNIESRLIKFRKTDPATGCWIFTGHTIAKGYGIIHYEGKDHPVHRVSMHVFKGFDLDSSDPILHKNECHNRRCFNPDHLYKGTSSSNTVDAIKLGTYHNIGEAKREATHCRRGHEFTKENTYTHGGYRRCKTCLKAWKVKRAE